MRAFRSLVTYVAAGVVLCVVATTAQAQTADQRNRARQLYGEAQALFDAGNYAQAEASFRAAYQAVPNPVVLKAIAASQEHQGNISGAIATLEEYLRSAPSAPDRAEVEGRLADLRARPATVVVTSTPPGASIVVDGQDSGQTTPSDVQLQAGEHTVELRLSGYAPAAQTFTTRAATRVRLELNLTASTGSAVDPFGAEGGDGQAADGTGGGGGGGGSSDPSAGVWALAGIGAAGLISGTVFGFLALSEQSTFDNAPAHDVADRGETYALIADISFGVAVAGAAAAIILYIVEQSGSSDSDSATVVPYVDPNGGGVAARVRF